MSAARRHFGRIFWRNQVNGLLFASPFIIGCLAFSLYPFVSSLYYGFTDFSLLGTPHWIGLANFRQIVFRDANLRIAVFNTGYLVLLGIPIYVLWALATAFLLNLDIRGKSAFRSIYFVPAITPAVAGTYIWLWMLNPRTGIVSYYLSLLGIVPPLWFMDPNWAKPGVIILMLWGVGLDTVIFLTALQGVPKELHEAAQLEGANWWSRSIDIDLPMISPAILFVVVNSVIWALQYFTQPYLITMGAYTTGGAPTGGRESSLLFLSIYIWANAFQYVKMGYASAMAWLMFICNLALTAIMLRVSRERVFYG